jgi:hypothetical protein
MSMPHSEGSSQKAGMFIVLYNSIFTFSITGVPITLAALSKERNVFARSNTSIVEEYHLLGCDAVWSVEMPPAYLLVLAEIFFDPEDGGDMFFRNVGCISTDYTASHPRK